MSNLEDVLAEELKMLVRATRSERFRFIIIQFNHYGLIKKVEKELINAYPQRVIHHLNVGEANTNNFVSSIFDCKEGFALIENFEKLLEESHRPLALGLNQRRDKFANYPLILIAFLPWGSSYLQACQKVMPDMFSLAHPIIQLQEAIEKPTEPTINTQFDKDEYFNNTNDAQEEIDRIQTRLKTLENTPENSPLRINLTLRLGSAYRFLGEYQEAKKVYTQLQQEILNEETYDETWLWVVENDLALVLRDLGDYEEAKVLLEKATISNEKNFGKFHPTTAISYSNLATVLRDLGDYEEAKVLLEKVKISDEKNFGEWHPNTAISYSNLATVLRDLGDYEGAKVLLEKAIISNEKNFGKWHPNMAISYSNLALALQSLGDYKEAKVLLEKAMRSDEKNFGEFHHRTAISYSNLAMVLKDLGDYKGAKKLLEKAYKVYRNHVGEQHPNTRIVKANLDSVRQKIKVLNTE